MIVCSCGSIMKAEKIGVLIEEVLHDGHPYKVWAADWMVCRNCGAVCFKTANQPTAEHFEENYLNWAFRCILRFGEGRL